MTLPAGNLIVDGVRLACRDHGRGTPVVFIHGTPSHAYAWRDVVAHDIGGAVGLRFAVDRPGRVRRLLITDSVSYDS